MNFARMPLNWAQENPKCATAAAVGMGVVAAPAIVTAPLLGLVGFGANGVVGGSIAAGVQAGIGNVLAGSGFATLTSAGMGGYGAATVATAGQAAGAAVAAAACLMGRNGNQTEQDDGQEAASGNGDDSDNEGGSDVKEGKGPNSAKV